MKSNGISKLILTLIIFISISISMTTKTYHQLFWYRSYIIATGSIPAHHKIQTRTVLDENSIKLAYYDWYCDSSNFKLHKYRVFTNDESNSLANTLSFEIVKYGISGSSVNEAIDKIANSKYSSFLLNLVGLQNNNRNYVIWGLEFNDSSSSYGYNCDTNNLIYRLAYFKCADDAKYFYSNTLGNVYKYLYVNSGDAVSMNYDNKIVSDLEFTNMLFLGVKPASCTSA